MAESNSPEGKDGDTGIAHGLVLFALLFNVVVCYLLTIQLLILKPVGMDEVYGNDTDARRILACMYFAIAVVSTFLLLPVHTATQRITAAWPLLTLQMVYKLTTVAAVGLSSPVVVSNLIIAI